MAGSPGARLPHPVLMLITDSRRRSRSGGGRGLLETIDEAVSGGVNIVQLREKHLDTRELISLGRPIRRATAGRALLVVNGDTEAAVALDADGVHLPEAGPPIEEARARAGNAMLISRAVHGIVAAVEAEQQGADLIQFGTVFETASKPGAAPAGMGQARAVCENLSIPVIAVGGMTAANAADAMSAGVAGVAVIGAIFDAPDPRSAAEALWRAIGSQPLAVPLQRRINE